MASLKKEFINGVFWSAIDKYSGLMVSIIVSMVLARILSPKEYGIIAIATVFIYFLQMFCTMGLGPAVIQRKDLSKDDLNSIFTFAVFVGFLVSLLFFCSSWAIADFYDNSLLIPICQILSLQLLFASANIVPNALMLKNKKFKQIAKRTILLQITTGILSVFAAYNGLGVFSLVISPVLTAIGIFIYNNKFYTLRIDFKFRFEPIKRIFSYSSYQFLFDFVNYFSRNLDKLIIGRYMSISSLGIYEKSYRLMQLPMNTLTSVVNPVLQPLLRNMQDDTAEMATKYNKLVSLMSSISFPLGIFCSFSACEIIRIFYGDNWDSAISVFSILSLSLPLQIILSSSGALFMASNNTKTQFWVGMRNTLTTVTGFVIAAIFWGTIEAIAWAWVITLFLNFVCTYFILYRYVFHTNLLQFYKILINPALNAILLAVVLSAFMACFEFSVYLMFIIKVIISLGVSLLFIQYTMRYDIFLLLKNIFKK